jgi:hypothetical protein
VGYGNLGGVDDRGSECRGSRHTVPRGVGSVEGLPLPSKIFEKLYANLCISQHSGS